MSTEKLRLTMEEFVQKVTIEDYDNHGFMVYVKDDEDNSVIGIDKRVVDVSRLKFDHTKETIVEAVSAAIEENHSDNTNMYVDDDHVNASLINDIIEDQAANHIVRLTRRGHGNIVLDEKYVSYIGNNGENLNDTGLTVYKRGDTYAVVTVDDVENSSFSTLKSYFVKVARD